MAATVTIRRWTGDAGSPTKTNITNTNARCNAVDSPFTNQTLSPVIIPDGGLENYSFWCSTRLSVDVAPGTGIDDIVWYTDGVNGLGVGRELKVAKANDYVEATGIVGQSGDELTMANHAELVAEPVDAFGFTIASPLSVTGSIGATTGDLGQFVVHQHVIGPTAQAGAGTPETISYFFDEI